MTTNITTSNLNQPNRICKYEAETFDDYIINSVLSLCNLTFENTFSALSFSVNKLEFIKLITKICYNTYYIVKCLPTEGQRIFNTAFDYSKDKSNIFSDNIQSNFSNKKKFYFLFLKIILPYLSKNKFFINYFYNLFNKEENDSLNEYSNLNKSYFLYKIIKFIKKYIFNEFVKNKLEKIINIIETIISFSQLINFCLFLYNGEYPSLVTRLLNIKYVINK